MLNQALCLSPVLGVLVAGCGGAGGDLAVLSDVDCGLTAAGNLVCSYAVGTPGPGRLALSIDGAEFEVEVIADDTGWGSEVVATKDTLVGLDLRKPIVARFVTEAVTTDLTIYARPICGGDPDDVRVLMGFDATTGEFVVSPASGEVPSMSYNPWALLETSLTEHGPDFDGPGSAVLSQAAYGELLAAGTAFQFSHGYDEDPVGDQSVTIGPTACAFVGLIIE